MQRTKAVKVRKKTERGVERGVVIKLDGEFAVVSFRRHARCDICRACNIDRDGRGALAKVKNTLNANVGDVVKVDMKQCALALSSLIYVLPLALVCAGVGIGYSRSAGAVALLAAVGLIVGLAISLPLDLAVIKPRLKPRMKEFCSPEDENS